MFEINPLYLFVGQQYLKSEFVFCGHDTSYMMTAFFFLRRATHFPFLFCIDFHLFGHWRVLLPLYVQLYFHYVGIKVYQLWKELSATQNAMVFLVYKYCLDIGNLDNNLCTIHEGGCWEICFGNMEGVCSCLLLVLFCFLLSKKVIVT